MSKDDEKLRGNVMTSGDRIEQQMFKDARRDVGIPQVNISYPRTGSWSGDNQLGVELPFQLDANRMQTIFKMDEWGFPQVWTVSLGLSLPKPLIQGQIFDVTAQVSFGSGGIVQEFDVDWVEGTMFSLPMNAVNIRARWSDRAFIEGIAPPDGIRISALIAHGGLRHARATFTNFFGLLPVGQSVTFGASFQPIPAFAKSVIVVPATPGDAANLYAAGSSLSFLMNDNTAAPAYILNVPGTFLGPTSSFKVPIPATARYWTFTNGGVAPASGELIWSLFDE
jgi:hypothetical protein